MDIKKFAKEKIKRHCTVCNFKLASIALSHSGEVIASATNKRASGVISEFSEHAEEALVRRLKKLSAIERYKYIDVMVLRMKKNGEFGLAKPCPGCYRLLTNYGVRNIYYTDSDGKIILQ